MAGRSGAGVVHLVGRLNERVFGFLGPATAALAAKGVPQTLVVADTEQHRVWLTQVDARVQVVLAPAADRPWRRWRMLLRTFHTLTQQAQPQRIHLHGFASCVLGSLVARALRPPVPMFYSPHDSRSMASLQWVARLTLWALRPLLGLQRPQAIAGSTGDVDTLASMLGGDVPVVETNVSEAYLTAVRRESRQPVVMTACRKTIARSAERFSQLAVLLGGDALQLRFLWIGPADADSQRMLKAADVTVTDAQRDEARAALLAEAWIYVEPDTDASFAQCLVEAMAVGVPCVVMDTSTHRDLVRDGENGFLCRSEEDVLSRVAALVDQPALRERIGAAARLEAERRFSVDHFSDSLMSAYQLEP